VLKPGEEELVCLKRTLQMIFNGADEEPCDDDFEVLELLAMWYRPNFESEIYPYCPAHIKVTFN
jgi:cleavage and polyadenylation specificity factor subunit 5